MLIKVNYNSSLQQPPKMVTSLIHLSLDNFVRELVEQMKISIVYITTKQMVADLLTKAVSKLTFETLVGSLFGKEM